MKKRKLLIPICLLLSFTACSSNKTTEDGKKQIINPAPVAHEHTYSDIRMYDEEYHWFPATCGHKDAVKQKEKHNFGNWTIEKDSTIFEEGTMVRACQNCGYKESTKIEKKSNKGLVIDNPYTVLEAVSTFNSLNDYTVTDKPYYVTGKVTTARKTSGGYTLFFEGTDPDSNAPFTFIDGVIDSSYVDTQYEPNRLVDATVIVYGYVRKGIASDGVRFIYEMRHLNYDESPTGGSISPKIVDVKNAKPAEEHVHEFATNWSRDDNYHWYAAICEHTDLKKNNAPHNFSDWYVSGEATTTQTGTKYRECTICGYRQEDIIPLHVHSFDSTKWEWNANTHWHPSTCGHDVKDSESYHNFSDWYTNIPATTTNEGLRSRRCTICDYVQEEIIPIHVHTFNNNKWESDTYTHWHPSTCGHDLKDNENSHIFDDWFTERAPTTTSTGLETRTCTICSYKQERTIPKLNPVGSATFTLYTFNDFHGAVNQYSNDAHIGLGKFGTYLKQVSEQDNVLIIDSGDTYQGSIESNWNHGAMITDVFNYAHVDVHTLGNHDFDWGEDKIESNKARTYSDGWHMTNLGANIYDYYFDTVYEGDTHQTRLGDKYYIKTLKNGLKVGVVGVIARDQITSICSPLVQDICFKEHIQILQDLSDELRTDKGCDVVIASVHESAAKSMNKGLSDVSPVSNKKYFDYVACAHSHEKEEYTENGVPFTQAIAYGEGIFKAEITVNNGNVTNYDVNFLDYDNVVNAVSTVDPNITSIIAKYSPEYSSVGNETLVPFANGDFYKNNQLPNMLCKAMFLEARKQGYYVDFAFTNSARYDIKDSPWTYSTIYEAFPFDNVIYVARIRGQKNVKEVCNYNNRYHEASLQSVSTTQWYIVAVIDYLLFHTNSNRSYDYFDHSSTNMEILGTLKKNGENYLYRDILADYLRSEYAATSKTLNYSDYLSSGDEYKKPAIA